MTEFEGLRAIVTGGGSGIGAAVADRLASLGTSVAVLDLDPRDTPHLAFTCDVADDHSVRVAVAEAIEGLGGLDILVNNAGIGTQGNIEANDDAEWHRVWDINVVGIARVTRAALPSLRTSSAASIVNVCSVAATAGLPERALYSATKGAVLSLTRAMAADHLREGIRVNSVGPGTANTPWINRLLAATDDPASERAALESRQPHGRLISPEEVAHAVVGLASPLASSTAGVNLPVDGGMDALRLRPVRS